MNPKKTRMSIKETRLTKEILRSKICLRLNLQKEEGRERKSRRIEKKLFRTGVFKKAKIILFYIAFDGEVKTQRMIKEAQRFKKTIAVPVCDADLLKIRPCILEAGARLKNGPYGIKEPAIKKPIAFKDLDLVIVPAVAFDKKNNRLGRGKGYYDRLLKRFPANTSTIGLAFDFQILPSIPASKTDIKVRDVIFA